MQLQHCFTIYNLSRIEFFLNFLFLKVRIIFVYICRMAIWKSKQLRLILIGLICAFLHSALILPLAYSSVSKTEKQNLALSQTGDSHSTPNSPISLPGEEKEEEENRAEKDSKLIIFNFDSILDFSFNQLAELKSFCLVSERLVNKIEVPIFLLKRSLLI